MPKSNPFFDKLLASRLTDRQIRLSQPLNASTAVSFSTNISRTKQEDSVDKFVDDLQKNPFLDKYKDKLRKIEQQNEEEFNRRVQERAQMKYETMKHPIEPPKLSKESESTDAHEISKPKQPESAASRKRLQDILKLDLLEGKNAEDVNYIWNSHFSSKENNLSACIPKDFFEQMLAMGKKYQMFLLPVPRGEGFEFFVLAWDADGNVHFTPLAFFQKHGENAPIVLVLNHYQELTRDIELVLMQGEYDPKVMGPIEAQCLVNELQLYYGAPNEERIRLLEAFTNSPAEFDHAKLIDALMSGAGDLESKKE